MKFLPFLVLIVPMVAGASEPVGFQRGMALLHKYGCQSCHSVDEARSGPSLHAIAKRYASDPHAESELSANILNGSIGAWGGAPMPPVKVPAADLKPLVQWILSLNQY